MLTANPHRKNGARRATNDLFCNAAHKEASQAGASVRAHNDQVAALALSRMCNLSCRIAFGQEMDEFNSRARGRRDLLQFAAETLSVSFRLELAGDFAERHVLRPQSFHDVKDQELSAIIPGKIDSDLKCLPGVVRKICRV